MTSSDTPVIAAIVALVVVLIVVIALLAQDGAHRAAGPGRNVERLGRYRKTLEPGMNVIIPFVDRVKPLIDLREQVVSFLGQPVITEDNLVVSIDTVLFFQVTDPRAADYEIVNYIQAIEQLTATMLRSVIGSMDLEVTLTSRDKINTCCAGARRRLREVGDPGHPGGDQGDRPARRASSTRWRSRCAPSARSAPRSSPPRASGSPQILTAEGDRQGAILRAEGDKQARSCGRRARRRRSRRSSRRSTTDDPDPKLLAYQYLQALPEIANGTANTMWFIPAELTRAMSALGEAFGASTGGGPARAPQPAPAPAVTTAPAGEPSISEGPISEPSISEGSITEGSISEPPVDGPPKTET